jgi:hypothetical protein
MSAKKTKKTYPYNANFFGRGYPLTWEQMKDYVNWYAEEDSEELAIIAAVLSDACDTNTPLEDLGKEFARLRRMEKALTSAGFIWQEKKVDEEDNE